MDIRSVVAAIEQTAPLSIAAGWDHSGMQVPAERDEVTHLALCLDPTPASVRGALDLGADMILSHHPLSLSPRFPDSEGSYLAVLRALLRADVPLYAAHTSLDANPDGPSGWLARALGMRAPRVLEPTGSLLREGLALECGFGLAGDLARPVSLEAILALTGGVCPRLIGGLACSALSRIAICPGSGASLASRAAQAGAELLVTGDLKYHDALDAPLPILDVGHFTLEEPMMRLFAVELRAMLPALTVSFVAAADPFCNPSETPLCGGR